MRRLHPILAFTLLAMVGQVTVAHAAEPAEPPQAVNAADKLVTSSSMSGLMVVLDVLGIVEKNAPKGIGHARTPTWLAPEPPKTPLLYSSLVVAKF